MTRIIEPRSALPFGAVVKIHVQRDVNGETPVLATVEVATFGQCLDSETFPQPVPAPDALLQALAYAERAGIASVWIDDPGGHFPPDKRPTRDVSAP